MQRPSPTLGDLVLILSWIVGGIALYCCLAVGSLPAFVDQADSNRANSIAENAAVEKGCGSPDGVTLYDQSECGRVGDPYEGKGAPSTTRGRDANGNSHSISDCVTSLVPSNNDVYTLERDIGTNPAATCLNFGFSGSNYKLNLNGHTVTGQIKDQGGFGRVIFNGTINCAIRDGSNTGCINYYPQSTSAWTQTRFHHLTVHNSNPGSRDIYVEWDGGTNNVRGCQVRIDHVTFNPVISSGRSYAISFTGSGAKSHGCFEADHNSITMPSDSHADAIQGIAAYNIALTAQFNSIHNNRFIGAGDLTDSYRSILCDGVGAPVVAQGPCIITNNYVDVQNNRAVRIRSYTNYNIQYNFFDHIRADSRRGAVHIGEPDSGLDNDVGTVQNNTFVIQDGKAVYVAQAVGPTIRHNLVICDVNDRCVRGALFGFVDILGADAGQSNAVWNDNPTVSSSGLPAPQIVVCDGRTNCTNNAGIRATASVCNSGSAAGGGQIEIRTTCP